MQYCVCVFQCTSLWSAPTITASRDLSAAPHREEPASAGARKPIPHRWDPRLAPGVRTCTPKVSTPNKGIIHVERHRLQWASSLSSQVRPHFEVGAVSAGWLGHLSGHAEAALHEGAGTHCQILRGVPAGAVVRGGGSQTAAAVVRPAAQQELHWEHVTCMCRAATPLWGRHSLGAVCVAFEITIDS